MSRFPLGVLQHGVKSVTQPGQGVLPRWQRASQLGGAAPARQTFVIVPAQQLYRATPIVLL